MPRKWPERTLKEIDLRLFLHFLELQKDACGIGTVSENGIVKPMTQAILFFWGGEVVFFGIGFSGHHIPGNMFSQL